MNVEHHIGVRQAHRRAFVIPLCKPVSNGILHFISYELRMSEDMGIDYRID